MLGGTNVPRNTSLGSLRKTMPQAAGKNLARQILTQVNPPQNSKFKRKFLNQEGLHCSTYSLVATDFHVNFVSTNSLAEILNPFLWLRSVK